MGKSEPDIIHRTRVAVISALAMLILGLVGSAVAWRMHLSYEVNGKLRALQRAGLPTNGAELHKWYASVPDRENAALGVPHAFALMRTFPDLRSNEVSRFKPPPRRQPLTLDQAHLLSDYGNLNAAALGAATAALK